MATATEPKARIDFKLGVSNIESGVPLQTISRFVSASGVPLKDIYNIVIPARTLKHRRARHQRLSVDESDKLARLVRVFQQAERTFGDPAIARDWLDTPKKRFDDRTPIQMLRTEVGARRVEEMLGQIEYGIFA
jgi:putative toxin-antitoxin system antitoxin component (TIGR02293 family)